MLKLGALATVAGLALAGCASERTAQLGPAVIPQNAVAPPPVALSSRVIEQASDYRTFMRRATAISPSFRSGRQIEESLSEAETFEAQQLSRGAVAFGALVALQDPTFVANVRTYAVDPAQRRDLAQRLVSDPNYAAVLPGAQSAAGLVIATLNSDAYKLSSAGAQVKQSAYDVQHQAWSKANVPDPDGRLAAAKSVSAQPMTPEPRDFADLQGAVNGADSRMASKTLLVSGEAAAPPFTPVVSRALAVAALAALGEGGDDHDDQVEGLLSESSGGFCLNMTKLNLYQCLAVARPYYEDIFCLGQHALIDTGQCIAKGAGQAQSGQAAAMTPIPTTATPLPVATAANGTAATSGAPATQ